MNRLAVGAVTFILFLVLMGATCSPDKRPAPAIPPAKPAPVKPAEPAKPAPKPPCPH